MSYVDWSTNFLRICKSAVKNNLNAIGLFLKLDCYSPFVDI